MVSTNFVGFSENPAAPALTAAALNSAFSLCEGLSNKAAPLGYCPLDANALVPLPNIDPYVPLVPVSHWGVVGNGAVDDTENLNTAVASGKNLSLRGLAGSTFLTTGAINVAGDGQVIRGSDRNSCQFFIGSGFSGSAVFNVSNPYGGPTISDVGFIFDQPDTNARSSLHTYPPAILVTDTVRGRYNNIRVSGGSVGIQLQGNCGGTDIISPEIGCFTKAVAIDGAKDTVRISRGQFFPFNMTANQQQIFYAPGTVGISSGRCDGLFVDGCLFLCNQATDFYLGTISGSSGPTFGRMIGCGFDTFSGYTHAIAYMQLIGCYFTMTSGSQYGIKRIAGDLQVIGCNFVLAAAPTAGAVVIDQSTDASSELIFTGNLMKGVGDVNTIGILISGSNSNFNVSDTTFNDMSSTASTVPRVRVTGGYGTVKGCRVDYLALPQGSVYDLYGGAIGLANEVGGIVTYQNLPTTLPASPNTLWVDSNGFFKTT